MRYQSMPSSLSCPSNIIHEPADALLSVKNNNCIVKRVLYTEESRYIEFSSTAPLKWFIDYDCLIHIHGDIFVGCDNIRYITPINRLTENTFCYSDSDSACLGQFIFMFNRTIVHRSKEEQHYSTLPSQFHCFWIKVPDNQWLLCRTITCAFQLREK